jgi:hypothetical protein
LGVFEFILAKYIIYLLTCRYRRVLVVMMMMVMTMMMVMMNDGCDDGCDDDGCE